MKISWYNVGTALKEDLIMAKHYDKQFKLDAVQYYHDYRDLGLQGCASIAYYGYQRPHLCPQAAIICFVTAGAEQSFVLLDCLTS